MKTKRRQDLLGGSPLDFRFSPDTVNERAIAIASRYTFLRLLPPTTQTEADDQASYVYYAECPLHADREASFRVTANVCYCRACRFAGTPERLYARMEAVPDGVATYEVADLVNEAGAVPELEDRLAARRANAMALGHYRKTLLREGGQGARTAQKYLASRNISEATLREFGVGFAPSYDGEDSFSHGEAVRQGLSPAALDHAGLLNRRGGDLFARRITFPSRDRFGRVTGFAARALPKTKEEDDNKYYNSKGTKTEDDGTGNKVTTERVYEKSRALFGLNLAFDAIASSRFAIVVEGPVDVLAMHQAGIPHAVSPLGTAIRAEQIQMLSPYADTIYLLLDSDEAGEDAVGKLIDRVDGRVNMLACPMPGGAVDPAEYFESGKKAFEFRADMRMSATSLSMFAAEDHDRARSLGVWRTAVRLRQESDQLTA